MCRKSLPLPCEILAADAAAEVDVGAADGFELVAFSSVVSAPELSFLIESLFPCLLLGECLRAVKTNKTNEIKLKRTFKKTRQIAMMIMKSIKTL